MNRREFIGRTTWLMPLSCTSIKGRAKNERLQIAAIGVGGKGGSDFHHLSRHGHVIAACDIDRKKLEYALRSNPQATRFHDYREMLSRMGEQIDVLSISTPDHTHAHAAKLAMELGIHLFVQAPLAHSVEEVRLLEKLSRAKKISTQLGLQGSASDSFREGVEFLRSGILGEVLEIHAWTHQPLWSQAPVLIDRPKDELAIPENLDWNCFLGPALHRPYHQLYQPYKWRGWRDFGTGALGAVGIHLFNLPFMGCGLNVPSEVECLSRGPVNAETYSAWGIIRFSSKQTGGDKHIPLYWYEGKIGHLSEKLKGVVNHPPLELFCGLDPSPNGCIIKGSGGTFYSPSQFGDRWSFYTNKKWYRPEDLSFPKGSLKRNGRGDSGLKDELISSIRKQEPGLALAGFKHGANLSQMVLLGNIVLFAGGRFTYDNNLGISDREEINRLLKKTYRSGWELGKA